VGCVGPPVKRRGSKAPSRKEMNICLWEVQKWEEGDDGERVRPCCLVVKVCFGGKKKKRQVCADCVDVHYGPASLLRFERANVLLGGPLPYHAGIT